jgi:molybdopterin synthase catalytic subunit
MGMKWPCCRRSAEDKLIEITRESIRPETVIGRVLGPQCGAVVTFFGTVRNNFEGKRVLYLEYEAYPAMALKKLEEIAVEIKRKFPVEAVAVTHRLGRLEIGEISVVIAVSAGHRQAAFEGCQYAIDRIKEIVPIWKKEYYEDGAAWVEGAHHIKV